MVAIALNCLFKYVVIKDIFNVSYWLRKWNLITLACFEQIHSLRMHTERIEDISFILN